MSRSVDLFIEADLPLGDLAGAVASQCDVRLSADPDHGCWVVQDGPVRAVLAPHRYVDDGELPLSRYPYALSARVGAGRPQDSAEAALLRRIGHRLQESSGWPVLLVLDLQYRDTPRPEESVAPGGAGAGGAVDAGGAADDGDAADGGGAGGPGGAGGAVGAGAGGPA